MGIRKSNAFWLILGVLVTGCAGLTYKNYGMSGVDYSKGMLLGADAKDDLPFSKCAPGPQVKFPCTIMFAADFYAMKRELLELRTALQTCQKGQSP
jgi:hypothetical protein